MRVRRIFRILICLAIFSLEVAYGSGRKEGTYISPETFLRGYDPITVYFDGDVGPLGGGPLDDPGDVLSIIPSHPGEYRWVDSRTLQFLPAVAWPILRQYEIRAGEDAWTLHTLMVPPTEVTPAGGSKNLEPLKTIALSFKDPIGIHELAAMISFEIKPLPGFDETESVWLTDRDFTIKELDRVSQKDRADYRLSFPSAIGYGKHITMYLRLSLNEAIEGSLVQYTFQTRPEFRLVGAGCGYVNYPLATNGSLYTPEQAIDCGEGSTPLFLEFTENLGTLGIEQVKGFARFEPAVENLSFKVSKNRLYLYFDVKREQSYKLSIKHQDIRSESARPLSQIGLSCLYFYYRQASAFLRWQRGQAIVERFGPQYLPMEGRATEKLDLRIYRIDPLDRNFWPFPLDPVVADEERPPKMPGEEPRYATQLVEQIKLMGSPDVSEIVTLPLDPQRGPIRFGLDLEPYLHRVSGHWQPGAYLVGYRQIGTSTKRTYARLLVTDLSLSTIEEEHAITFVVTSLRTASPISGAQITIEGEEKDKWEPVIKGITDSAGRFRYNHTRRIYRPIRRIIVTYGNDVLVLDPTQPPPHFQNNHWFGSSSGWLSWLNQEPKKEKEASKRRGYILTERPVYRPEEPVHILGYLRNRQEGMIVAPEISRRRSVVIDGPGRKYWTFPIQLSPSGQFHLEFSEKDLPTGTYTAILKDEESGTELASVSFKKESYRIPRFELNVTGPDRVPMDRPFELVLTADYYAGGRVVGQPVTWEITQYPYRMMPPAYPGYMFSTDERFSGGLPFRATGSSRKEDVTDENGSAKLMIDPTVEEDGRPRSYIVEATVRGADAQTVTTVKQVIALPAFVLGVRSDRLLKEGRIIRPDIIVIDHNETPVAGMPFKLRLYRREWHSYLRETDFTTGEAQYVTDVVDRIVHEASYTSTKEPLKPELPVEQSGVYVIELLAKDRLGRLQRVQTDLYVPGDEPVAWKKTEANVFETSLDKTKYSPGDRAVMLLKSPFQKALALIIVEGPQSNDYSWVEIENGQGLFNLRIEQNMTPGLPIHALLLRGRLKGTSRRMEGREDRGRPIAMASTTWVTVDPVANSATLRLEHRKINLPGSRMKMKLHLSDPGGRPLDGEVALWLVDRAVLALGEERPIDPLSAFIDPALSYIRLRETRNEVVGNLPVEEMPGGAEAEEYEEAMKRRSLLERTTVRRQFKTVPYFNPAIKIRSGYGEIDIDLPDNLTEFAVRAIAASGVDRFGMAQSVVSIRLPVIVQSALPRFVRPGDSFVAGGIGRIVEGEGGPGLVQIEVEGLQIAGRERQPTLTQDLLWDEKLPARLFFSLTVPKSFEGEERDQVVLRMAVERTADQARDAFEMKLPVKHDVRPQRIVTEAPLKAGETVPFPVPDEKARPGSVVQSLVLTQEPALLRLLAGMNMLMEYEHLCTEQRVSQSFPAVALKGVFDRIGLERELPESKALLTDAFTYLESTLRPDGLYGFWPGSRGYVGLTAYVVEFLVQAKASGFEFEEPLLERPIAALKEALRSDYNGFVPGYAFKERVEALTALASAGYLDDAYAQDLLVGALNSDLYDQAKILHLFLGLGEGQRKGVQRLLNSLWQSAIFKLRDDREVFAGLDYRNRRWGGLVLASEVKTLAGVVRALYRAEPENPRVRLMIDDLVARGDFDGWGSTNANAAALFALADILGTSALDTMSEEYGFELLFDGRTELLPTPGRAVTTYTIRNDRPVSLRVRGPETAKLPHSWITVDYVSDTSGDRLRQRSSGFVVERELLTVGEDGRITERRAARAQESLVFERDTVVEEHVRVVNPETRNFVAVRVPFASGFEPMNPELATAPSEARPEGKLTLNPSYTLYEDDRITFYYDRLPEGSYDFYFRLRASFEGSFTHPPARAELMYDARSFGRSDGTRIVIKKVSP
jgi:uncharacterized protein YfaS (alpha-2-macroglobulin family)